MTTDSKKSLPNAYRNRVVEKCERTFDIFGTRYHIHVDYLRKFVDDTVFTTILEDRERNQVMIQPARKLSYDDLDKGICECYDFKTYDVISELLKNLELEDSQPLVLDMLSNNVSIYPISCVVDIKDGWRKPIMEVLGRDILLPKGYVLEDVNNIAFGGLMYETDSVTLDGQTIPISQPKQLTTLQRMYVEGLWTEVMEVVKSMVDEINRHLDEVRIDNDKIVDFIRSHQV